MTLAQMEYASQFPQESVLGESDVSHESLQSALQQYTKDVLQSVGSRHLCYMPIFISNKAYLLQNAADMGKLGCMKMIRHLQGEV